MKFYTLNGMVLCRGIDYEHEVESGWMVLDVEILTSSDRVVVHSDEGADELDAEVLRRRCRTCSLAVEVDADCPICARRELNERVEVAERTFDAARAELEAVSSSTVRKLLFGVLAELSPFERQVLKEVLRPVLRPESEIEVLSDLSRRATAAVNSASLELEAAREARDR